MTAGGTCAEYEGVRMDDQVVVPGVRNDTLEITLVKLDGHPEVSGMKGGIRATDPARIA